MADGDLTKDKIRRVILPKRKAAPKVTQPKEWYQKKRMTINSKLRQEILDLFPFTMDKEEADKILFAIFDTIYEGLKKDGFVTIPGFGKFDIRRTWSGWVSTGFTKNRKYVFRPPRRKAGFVACEGLRRLLRDE